MKRSTNYEYENVSIFELLKPNEEKKQLLNVGDKIGKVVLGECRIATVTAVEGLPDYPFYRTDNYGCYSYSEGLKNIEELKAQAERERKKFKTIIPAGLEKRVTVRYKAKTGNYLWAQLGIYKDMLFWKESITYQFLEIYKVQKDTCKRIQKHLKNILEDFNGVYELLDVEIKMDRLYFSNKLNGYESAEYTRYNR